MSGSGNLEYENFIVMHCVTCDSDSQDAPNMHFKMLKSFQHPQSRMTTEAVLIDFMS